MKHSQMARVLKTRNLEASEIKGLLGGDTLEEEHAVYSSKPDVRRVEVEHKVLHPTTVDQKRVYGKK